MNVLEDLVSLMFPEGLLTYFNVTRVNHLSVGYEVYLEEKPDVPDSYKGRGYICHGFYDAQVIHDFPLRGKVFDLVVRRRRWKHPRTGKVIMRDWNLVAQGSSLSREFADFLKGIH